MTECSARRCWYLLRCWKTVMRSLLMSSLLLSAAAARPHSDVRGRPPELKVQHETLVVVRLGSVARISCPVYGAPRPLVSWSKDGQEVHIGWQRFRLHRSGAVLHIRDVRSTDSGQYTCTAINGFGSVSVNLQLDVVLDDDKYFREGTGTSSSALMTTASKNKTTDVSSSTDLQSDNLSTTGALETATTDDVMLTSLLCIGAVVCLTSFAVLVALAIRRRRGKSREKQVVVPLSAARSLLAVAKLDDERKSTSVMTELIGSALIHQHAIYRPKTTPSCRCAQQTTHVENMTSQLTAMRVLLKNQRNSWSTVDSSRNSISAYVTS